MRRFMVNIEVARIFNGVLEALNLRKNTQKFAKKGGKKVPRSGVNHVPINHTPTPTGLNFVLGKQLPLRARPFAICGGSFRALYSFHDPEAYR
jgi:hypothetical protein